MRTKALLTAAALAAGALSTMAQSNVYSLNIVGYANVSVPAGNFTYSNPLDLDGTNNADNVLAALPDASIVAVWTGNSFNTWWVENIGDPGGRWWTDSSDSVHKTPPLIPPGKGFYISPGSVYTNTFVGNVVPAPGTTNSLAIGAGNSLIGSPLPISGTLSNAAFQLSIPDATIISVWAGNHFNTYWVENIGDPGGAWWTDSSDSVHAVPPTINIGGAFYISPGSAFNWQQSLQ
jgi:hypothetical protein